MNLIKRNGQTVPFNKTKIKQAIVKAMRNGSGIYLPDIARLIANDAERYFGKKDETPTISQVEKLSKINSLWTRFNSKSV